MHRYSIGYLRGSFKTPILPELKQEDLEKGFAKRRKKTSGGDAAVFFDEVSRCSGRRFEGERQVVSIQW